MRRACILPVWTALVVSSLAAQNELKKLPEDQWQKVLQEFNAAMKKGPGDRSDGIETFGATGDPRVIPRLKDVIRTDKDTMVRATAARELGRLRDPRSADALISCLSLNLPPRVAEDLCRSLANQDPSKVVPALRKVITSTQDYTSLGKLQLIASAVEVLGSEPIKAREAIPDIIQVYTKFDGLAKRGPKPSQEHGRLISETIHAARAALVSLTGKEFDTPDAYAKWWKSNKDAKPETKE